ncbi:hypothetical protein AKO1_015377, partial [Acrasis kona]
TDVHSICGYVVAKYLFETYLSDKQSSILPQSSLLKHSTTFKSFYRSRKKTGAELLENVILSANNLKKLKTKEKIAAVSMLSWRMITRTINRFKNLFTSMTFEQKYLLIGAILANLPDLDVILSPFLGGPLHFHRTLTHSIYGNVVILPVAAFVVQKLLGLRGIESYSHCLWLSFLCVSSHIVTDYVTNYGTGIFYPLSKKMYTYGVITVWDLTTVVYFYTVLTASRSNCFKQSKVMLFGTIGFGLLMMWKRAMLCEAYSRSFYYMEHNHKKSHRNTYIWPQPNNIWNGVYSIMKYDMRNKTATELKTVSASPYLAIIHYINDVFGIRGRDFRRVQLSDTMGPLMGLSIPRDFFPNIYHSNKPLFNNIAKTCIPTATFMFMYHLISLLFIRGY